MCELHIRDLALEDAGEYMCVCGQERTSATLSVTGNTIWLCVLLWCWLGTSHIVSFHISLPLWLCPLCPLWDL